MNRDVELRNARLTTPRAAAVAGILFSVLLITALVLIRISIPDNPLDSGDWLAQSTDRVVLALDLVPFAGIAFLWFMGVVRDRLGQHEDRFFATVYLGSGLLFLAMIFASAGVAGGLMIAYGQHPAEVVSSGSYNFARAITYVILNTYAMRMAGVFMITSCTLFLRTRVMPRWLAWLGYLLALVLLLSISRFSWISLVFPLWVLVISVFILYENLKRKGGALAPDLEVQ